MKTFTSFLISVFFIVPQLFSQSILTNVNPDPNGEPWYVGSLRTLTQEDYNFLNTLPQLTVPKNQMSKDLPSSVDNSTQPYFRPVFSQEGGSCGQASGIGYTFTYEIDWERGLPANTPENQYPTHYTWNYLNGGTGGGSWYFDGWMIIKANGCPNILDWGGHYAFGGQSRWMSGYDEYYNGMYNRVYEIMAINVGTPDGLETLKSWMHDHMNGSEVGGIACFAAGVSNSFYMTTLPSGTPEAGKAVITRWDESVNHAMTFVGYNDEIKYDFNNDGQYTNDIDINGDNIVDMKDWEIGGVKLANSWGNSFGNQGFAYTMYKNLAEALDQGGIWSNTIHVITTKETNIPTLTLKANIKHDSRNKVKIIAGVSSDLSSDKPENILSFPSFAYQGGDFYMQGGYSNSDKIIEIGLDATPLLSYVNSAEQAKFFLGVVEKDPYSQGEGEIISFSLMNYSNGIEEVISDQQNVVLINDDSTFASVSSAVVFDKVEISTEELPVASLNESYSHQLEAEGGTEPYSWRLKIDYTEDELQAAFPQITDEQLTPSNDDDGFVIHQLDFPFPYYGQDYAQVTLLTDGAIVFVEEFSYIRSEESIIANKCIAAYCADLQIYPALGDGIWYSGDENSATFRWQTSKFDEPQIFIEMAVTLYPNGEIEFYYGDNITSGLNWAGGISSGDGSYSIAEISNSYTIPNGHATKFVSPPFPAGMQIAEDGTLYGTPLEENTTWNINFVVTDYSQIFSIKELTFSTILTDISINTVKKGNNMECSPNPFSSHSMLSFTIKHEEMVSLYIYGANGQLIKTIIDQKPLQPGKHTYNWDGSNDNGIKTGNGIYYGVLTSSDGQETTKMIHMR